GKMSVRGGYGIGYSRIPWGNFLNVGNPPFGKSLPLLNGTMTDPALGVRAPLGPQVLSWVGPPNSRHHPPRIQTWSLTVERELVPNGILSVAYVGSAARNIPGATDLNFPLPSAGPSVNDPGCLQSGQSIPAKGFDFDP